MIFSSPTVKIVGSLTELVTLSVHFSGVSEDHATILLWKQRWIFPRLEA